VRTLPMPPGLITVSTVLQTLLFVALLWKLWRSELMGKYPSFTAFVLFDLVRMGISITIPRDTNLYGWFYFLSQPVLWLMYALITLEVFKSVFRRLPGISRLSRYLVVVAIGAALLVSALSFMIKPQDESPFRILELYFTFERAICVLFLTVLLILLVFLSWYPAPVHRNALIYSGALALYFATKTGAFFIRTVGGPDFAYGASLMGISAALLSSGVALTLLNAAGETRRARPVRRITDEQEQELLAMLQSFNDALQVRAGSGVSDN
jgi:hypothetical protein